MLARHGRRVVVHERFEAARPVGAGFMLQPTGRHVMERLGLTAEVEALAQPIDRLFGCEARRRRVVLDVRYRALGEGLEALGVHRAGLFDILHRACLAAGVTIETGREIAGVDGGRLLDDAGRSSAAFDLVVDASGGRSRIVAGRGQGPRPLAYGALWATIPFPGAPFQERSLEQVYRGAAKMAGVLPVGSRPGETQRLATLFWSLRHVDHPRWLADGLDAWKGEVLTLWPALEPVLNQIAEVEQLTFARYGHHTLARPCGDRLAVIGDAAHSTSPQLGQGVNMALLDAQALADALEAEPALDDGLARYCRARRWHLRLYQAISLVFTPFYQSDDAVRPWIHDHLLSRLARLPFADRLLAATVSGLLLDPRR